MKDKPVKTSRPGTAFLLGLLATAAVAAVHLVGFDHRVELLTLDMRFRRFGTAPPNDNIVHVDIDDRSLEQLGRWPWPREQIAGIVDVLGECGARGIVLDVIFPWPQQPRLVSAACDLYQADRAELLGTGQPVPIFDDARLAESLETHGRVYLPMHIDFHAKPPAMANESLRKILATRPAATREQLAEEGLRLSESELRAFKQSMIEVHVQSLVFAQPDIDLETVRRRVLPEIDENVLTWQRDVLRKAYLRSRAIQSLQRFTLSPDRLRACPVRQGRITPPLVLFAQRCYRSGFVTFEPDADGVVRRIPLLGYGDGKLYPQFALSLASSELASRHGGSAEITASAGAVTIALADGTRRKIPIDEEGFMLINWPQRGTGDKHPLHISTAAVGSIHLQKQRMRKNRDLIRHYQLAWAKAVGHDMLRLFEKADSLYLRRIEAQRKRLYALLYEPADVPPPLEELRKQEQQVERDLNLMLSEIYEDFYLRGAPEEIKQLTTRTRKTISRLLRENERIEAEIVTQLNRLKAIVDGKICIIGSTATGAADFVPTPVYKRTPGVVVHSNIFNTIVSGAFVRKAGPGYNLLAIILAGLIVSLLAATRPVMLQAGPAMIILAGAYTIGNSMLLFARWSVWLVMVSPLAAMAGSFLIVSAYRQLTEERAKRRIRSMFAHALSPTLVDQLIANPSLARLGGERRELSCFFSDLAGFTSLSERLQEQETVRLLNRYFDRMTDVIQTRHGGYLNKFLGDGIFAFFGAPIPQTDHSRRALAAALDCRNELEELNRAMAGELPEAVRLKCRIGITTGQVMVGNCGSSQRMDYTAIGDCVNLASRLESANKFFGTQILVAEESLKRQYDDIFLARPLGQVLVVGKKEPIGIWELVGRMEEAPGKQVQAFADFAHGLELFSNREFGPAAEVFENYLRDTPDDTAARIYLGLCRQYLAAPPEPQWQPVLKLTEK